MLRSCHFPTPNLNINPSQTHNLTARILRLALPHNPRKSLVLVSNIGIANHPSIIGLHSPIFNRRHRIVDITRHHHGPIIQDAEWRAGLLRYKEWDGHICRWRVGEEQWFLEDAWEIEGDVTDGAGHGRGGCGRGVVEAVLGGGWVWGLG